MPARAKAGCFSGEPRRPGAGWPGEPEIDPPGAERGPVDETITCLSAALSAAHQYTAGVTLRDRDDRWYGIRWMADAARGTAALISPVSALLTVVAVGLLTLNIAPVLGRTAEEVGVEWSYFLAGLIALLAVAALVFLVQLLVAPARLEKRAGAAASSALETTREERDSLQGQLDALRRDLESRQLALTLHVLEARLIAVDDGESSREAWLERRREQFIGQLPPPTPPSVKGFLESSPILNMFAERRSEDDFRAAVDEYIDEMRRSWPQLLARRLIEAKVSRLILSVANPTDRRFDGVVLTLMLPQDFKAGFDGTDENYEFVPPEPPDAWGSVRAFPDISGLHFPPVVTTPWTGEIEAPGRLPQGHLPALRPAPALGRGGAGGTQPGRPSCGGWQAADNSVLGRCQGNPWSRRVIARSVGRPGTSARQHAA